MRVVLEKRYVDTYKDIVREANKAVREKVRVPKVKYEKTLIENNISVENKKKRLVKCVHELLINTFSLNVGEIKNKRKFARTLNQDVKLIREIIQRIKTINNYLEESLLIELGIIKKSPVMQALRSRSPVKFLEDRRGLSQEYLNKIEHTVSKLIHEIIFFDEELLKDYKKRESLAIVKEKIGIKDLEKILKTQSVLLDALEAKIPPAAKINAKLFGRVFFNKWMPLVFALLSNFETEYKKEKLIFILIKRNFKSRNKIEKKIKHIIDEKQKMLKVREEREMSMDKIEKISNDYRQLFHEYVSAASL